MMATDERSGSDAAPESVGAGGITPGLKCIFVYKKVASYRKREPGWGVHATSYM